MNSQEIQQKIEEVRELMVKYHEGLKPLEKGLFQAISDYQKALEEEKLKEIRQKLQ